jgi:hypothetical protein
MCTRLLCWLGLCPWVWKVVLMPVFPLCMCAHVCVCVTADCNYFPHSVPHFYLHRLHLGWHLLVLPRSIPHTQGHKEEIECSSQMWSNFWSYYSLLVPTEPKSRSWVSDLFPGLICSRQIWNALWLFVCRKAQEFLPHAEGGDSLQSRGMTLNLCSSNLATNVAQALPFCSQTSPPFSVLAAPRNPKMTKGQHRLSFMQWDHRRTPEVLWL